MTCEKDIKITIIGGSKGLGKWIAQKLKIENFNITITSRNKTSGEKIAKEMGVNYSNNNIDAVQDAKVILFCVPIEHMTETIKKVAPHAPENSLLMDITSIKTEPTEALLKYSPPKAEIIPCHPMFGPRVPSLDGQVVILTPPEDRCQHSLPIVRNFFKKKNVNLVNTTPEEHDKIMSVVQGLTHFSYISIASTIRKLDISVKESRKFSSPVYSLMLDMISRIVAQNPYLYYSIQKQNSKTALSRKTLINESIRLSEYIDNDEEDKFIEDMRLSAKHLDEFEEALGRSDKAISILNKDLNDLKESVGMEIALKHQYSGKIHFGVVESVSADEVVLHENNKDITLKISNISILDNEELIDWKIKNLKNYTFDLSMIFGKEYNVDTLLDVFSKIEPVINVEIKDIYTGKPIDNDYFSVTFHYTTFNKSDKEIVETYMKGLGGVIR